MDIKRFNSIADQQILSGKMIDIILQSRKQKELEYFLESERKKEEMSPLLDKLDDLGDKFDSVKSTIKQEFTLGSRDFDKGFTREEENLLNELGLEMPSKIWSKGSEYENAMLSNDLIQQLKYKKRSKRKDVQKDANEKSKVVNKLRNRIKNMQDLKTATKTGSGIANKRENSIGGSTDSMLLHALGTLTKGVDFGKVLKQANMARKIFTSPQDMVKRLKLLGGSIEAGNNNPAIEKEFVDIAHKLRNLGILNNTDLLKMMRKLTYAY